MQHSQTALLLHGPNRGPNDLVVCILTLVGKIANGAKHSLRVHIDLTGLRQLLHDGAQPARV